MTKHDFMSARTLGVVGLLSFYQVLTPFVRTPFTP
jgi:hypothetical protein